MKVDCLSCGRTLPARAAFISVRVAGNEKVHSWLLCPDCDAWTVETWTDHFSGDADVHRTGPLDRIQGDTIVAVARSCPRPSDVRCGCDAHRRLRAGLLDWR